MIVGLLASGSKVRHHTVPTITHTPIQKDSSFGMSSWIRWSPMPRSLAEDIERGRRAIALADRQGKDTTDWERSLAELERRALLAWASELAEQEAVLPGPISYIEAPRRTVTTQEVSRHAAQYLRTIARARLQQETGGWGRWTPEWWAGVEEEAMGALTALRSALDGSAPPPAASR
jgi:hypothetical protein